MPFFSGVVKRMTGSIRGDLKRDARRIVDHAVVLKRSTRGARHLPWRRKWARSGRGAGGGKDEIGGRGGERLTDKAWTTR